MPNIIMADKAGDSLWEYIDTISIPNLTDYTSTTQEIIDTSFSFVSLPYAFLLAIITSDAAITDNMEWGCSVQVFGRFIPSGNTQAGTACQMRGVQTLNFSEMLNNSVNSNSYGVWITSNRSVIQIARQCHTTAMTKVRGGNYTVKLYGLKSFG